MTDPAPVVLSYLKLPPEEQTLFRIRDIPTVFMEKLGLLHFALSTYEDAHSCPPRATEVLKTLREAAAKQVEEIIDFLLFLPDFAQLFLRLLDLMENTPFEDSTIEFLQSVSLKADGITIAAGNVGEKMGGFGRDILAAIREMKSVFDAGEPSISRRMKEAKEIVPARNSGENTLLTAKNSQIVSDLVSAVDECKVLLREVVEYFREMDRHLRAMESIESTPPTLEEIHMIRQRWISFSTSVTNLAEGLGGVSHRIRFGPRMYGTDVFDPSWLGTAAPTTADSSHTDQKSPSTGTQPEPRPISDTTYTSPHDTSHPAPNSTAVPDDPPRTIRSFLRRVFSCLSIKKFIF